MRFCCPIFFAIICTSTTGCGDQNKTALLNESSVPASSSGVPSSADKTASSEKRSVKPKKSVRVPSAVATLPVSGEMPTGLRSGLVSREDLAIGDDFYLDPLQETVEKEWIVSRPDTRLSVELEPGEQSPDDLPYEEVEGKEVEPLVVREDSESSEEGLEKKTEESPLEDVAKKIETSTWSSLPVCRNGGEYNKSKRELQKDTDYVDHSGLRQVGALTEQLGSIKTSSYDAWKALGGETLLTQFRDRMADNQEVDLEWDYADAVRLWYMASELAWMKSKIGYEPFALSESDTAFICSHLDNENYVKIIRDATTGRVLQRQKRAGGANIAYGVKRFDMQFAERHPLAKLPTICKNIPNEDVAFAIINHRIGRYIVEKIPITGLGPLFYTKFINSSTIDNVRDTLLEIGSGNVLTWLHGAGGDTGQVRDWYSNIGTLLLNPAKGFFEMDADGTLRLNSGIVDFSEIDGNNNRRYTKREVRLQYRGIGRYFAISLIEGMPLGAVFNYGFYLVLLNAMDVEKLTKKHLQLDDATYYTTWKVFGECDESQEMNCSNVCELFQDTVMTSTDGKRDLMVNGSEIALYEGNIMEYSKLLIQDYMYNRHKLIYEEILAGFNEMLPENVLDFVSIEHIRLIFQGNSAGSTAEQLKNSIKWPMYEMYAKDQPGYKWMNELFESEGQTFRNRFVRFATSLVVSPKGGFAADASGNGLIRISDVGSANAIANNGKPMIKRPKSYTCAYWVHMPQYRSKEQIRDMLLDSIHNLSFSYNYKPDPEELAELEKNDAAKLQ